MTGLLLKDFLYLKRQGRIFLFLLAFYIIFFAATGSGTDQITSMLLTLIPMLPMIVLTNAFAYDEMSKWNTYALTLPITRGKLVFARYLLTLLLTCGMALIPFLMNLLSGSLSEETGAAVYAAVGAALLLCEILIPLFYRFGTQKARLALLVIVLIPTLGAFLLKQARFAAPSDAQILFLLKISPVFLVVFSVVSYYLSCKILENKEN
ncbi:ABC-2 transporter permease [Caproiciproducens sp. CPB-2]|uniref:ABC-2 transporter permease n=1 Tax=Caproiciproducens sp. CPB-2 TaxID=3030017 RepID=UPI0023DC1EDA|nr:ABC-2 transporter permease [Caproiciproducens sp. CPB-2]MDF1496034.1 ABC-2 transporter permease [Caproiciproducens sp. CPB-2]